MSALLDIYKWPIPYLHSSGPSPHPTLRPLLLRVNESFIVYTVCVYFMRHYHGYRDGQPLLQERKSCQYVYPPTVLRRPYILNVEVFPVEYSIHCTRCYHAVPG